VGDEVKLAAAYNNLGYIIGLRSNYDSALRYCHRALNVQESLGLKHDSGRTHNTLGIIYRGKENYVSSLEHTDRALSIFQEIEDKEWMAIAYCERGITKWHMGQLEAADADLARSYEVYKETGLDLELVSILHRRGHVAWELGKMEKADEFFRESAEVGRRVSDFQQTINSLEGLVELYYDIGYGYHKQGDVEKRDEYYARAEEMARQWEEEFEKKGYYFPLYSGSRLRTLGNIAYDRGDYEIALQRYLKAYPRIASRGGYSKYMLPEALDWLQERIDQLPPRLAIEWCDRIQEYWEKEDRSRDFPEMISVCELGRDNARRRQYQPERKQS
jgi:tetratricopeptide (TPR) repeat protein